MVAAYGIDPVLFMLAAQVFGMDESELDVAGGIMGRGIELTEAEYVSLPIPAHAELVVEGLVHPEPRAPEGPLGEFTGYYGRERSPQPVMEVKAVHHRRSPILTAALMAKYPSCEIGAYYAIQRSARAGGSAGSMIGSIKETQEMLDFCGKHDIVADIELIKIQDVNAAFDRVVDSDVRYRFVIDTATLEA